MTGSNIQAVFDQLDDESLPIEERKRILRNFLKHQVALRRRHPERSRQLAYEIAGLLATATGTRLASDDPLMEVLLLAGELELPESVRDEMASWERLESLARRLPADR